jgi:hypothetical protein
MKTIGFKPARHSKIATRGPNCQACFGWGRPYTAGAAMSRASALRWMAAEKGIMVQPSIGRGGDLTEIRCIENFCKLTGAELVPPRWKTGTPLRWCATSRRHVSPRRSSNMSLGIIRRAREATAENSSSKCASFQGAEQSSRLWRQKRRRGSTRNVRHQTF